MIEKTETYYYCEVCGRRFLSKCEAIEHEKHCFKQLTFNTKGFTWKCEIIELPPNTDCLQIHMDGENLIWCYFKYEREILPAEKLIASEVLSRVSNSLSNCDMLPKIKISVTIENFKPSNPPSEQP